MQSSVMKVACSSAGSGRSGGVIGSPAPSRLKAMLALVQGESLVEVTVYHAFNPLQIMFGQLCERYERSLHVQPG